MQMSGRMPVSEAREDGGRSGGSRGTDETCSTILANLIGDGLKFRNSDRKGIVLRTFYYSD